MYIGKLKGLEMNEVNFKEYANIMVYKHALPSALGLAKGG